MLSLPSWILNDGTGSPLLFDVVFPQHEARVCACVMTGKTHLPSYVVDLRDMMQFV